MKFDFYSSIDGRITFANDDEVKNFATSWIIDKMAHITEGGIPMSNDVEAINYFSARIANDMWAALKDNNISIVDASKVCWWVVTILNDMMYDYKNDDKSGAVCNTNCDHCDNYDCGSNTNEDN